jgi:hypothetical protein
MHLRDRWLQCPRPPSLVNATGRLPRCRRHPVLQKAQIVPLSTQYGMIYGSSRLCANVSFRTIRSPRAGMVDELADLPHGGAARLTSAELVSKTLQDANAVIVPSGNVAVPSMDAADPSAADWARQLRQKYRSSYPLPASPRSAIPTAPCPGASQSSPSRAQGRSRRERAWTRQADASTTRPRSGWVLVTQPVSGISVDYHGPQARRNQHVDDAPPVVPRPPRAHSSEC